MTDTQEATEALVERADCPKCIASKFTCDEHFAGELATRAKVAMIAGDLGEAGYLIDRLSALRQQPSCDVLREALNAIIDRGPERDIKWAGMTARDIALAALKAETRQCTDLADNACDCIDATKD